MLNVIFILVISLLFRKELIHQFKKITFFSAAGYAASTAVFIFISVLLMPSQRFTNYPISFFFILTAFFIAPIHEELSFRFLFIDPKWVLGGKIFVCCISSLLFSYSHIQGVQGSIFALAQLFLLGIYLAAIYIKSENIFYCIFTHTTYNLLVYLLGVIF
ncbi:CPBP family intramembrane glutamic endopeptidase [Enterococcus mediterraneensis]|uniref:CPBP family intramembrane glutamic endopeptidase n=1 Tax=Enterococcus mediterraneensis TaxID=2364791 RepID=UPI0013DEBD9F|nr:CPBP family intramembrane glutamic endopeptidase [Enterococcus mediterraneensis]